MAVSVVLSQLEWLCQWCFNLLDLKCDYVLGGGGVLPVITLEHDCIGENFCACDCFLFYRSISHIPSSGRVHVRCVLVVGIYLSRTSPPGSFTIPLRQQV